MTIASVLSWEEVHEAVDELSRLVMASDFAPNVLVAVARGGWIPTRFLSDSLNVKRLASIGIVYEDEARSNPTVYLMPELPHGSAALLIEDFLESGRSIRDAKARIEATGAIVRTAALWVSPQSIHEPDFTLGVRDAAPHFPWERSN